MNVEFAQRPWVRWGGLAVGLLLVFAIFHLHLPETFPVPLLARLFSVKAATWVGWLLDLFAFAFMFVVGLVLISQFALPVNTWDERVQAISRIFDYTFGASGPVVFVKDGKLVASRKEMGRGGAGVALVDSTSAVVIERGARFSRAEGPGIVFLQPGERIRATLDLRWQVRSQPVAALTKDGIEVKTTLEVVFGLAAQAEPDEIDGDAHRPRTNQRRMKRPYPFDATSAFQAIYGTQVGKEAPVTWTDLPTLAAAERFRVKLARETLDGLLRPTTLPTDPLEDMDDDVTQDVRDRGLDDLMGSTGVARGRRRMDKPLAPPEDEEASREAEAESRPTQEETYRLKVFTDELTRELRDERILRDRGIEVRSVTLGGLELPRQVMQQRLDSWEAPWEKSAKVALAAGDVQGEVIKQRAQHQAQLEVANVVRAALKSGGTMWTEEDKERTRRRIMGALRLLATSRNRLFHSGDAMRIMAQMEPPKDSEREWLNPLLEEAGKPPRSNADEKPDRPAITRNDDEQAGSSSSEPGTDSASATPRDSGRGGETK